MKSHLFHLILTFIIACVAVAGYAFWYGAVTRESTTVADLQKQIDAKTEMINRVTSARATLAGIASDELTIQNYFIAGSDIVTFIDALQATGKTYKTDIQVLSGTAPITMDAGVWCGGNYSAATIATGSTII